jgi:hypothetical protein
VPSRRLALALTLTLVAVLATSSAPAAAAPHSPQVTFYFGLERPEAGARAAFSAVSRPGSATYRSFLGVRQVAQRYGARPRTIRAFRRAARRHGLRVRIDRSGVFARVSASVRRFERVLHVPFERVPDNDDASVGWFVRGSTRHWRLPRDMRPLVRETMPAYNRSVRQSRSRVGARGSQSDETPKPANAGTWTGGCSAARATGSYSFGQVRAAYGLAAVGTGGGGSAAILNAGEGAPAEDLDAMASCFGLPALRTRTLLTDGQTKPFGRGSFEPEEDLGRLRGTAPGLGSLTFTQTWETPQFWFLGAAQALAGPLPDVLSISYGECELDIRGKRAGPTSRASARLFDSVVVRLGLVGVATFASAGDFGSTCGGENFAGVTWPASSPYVTAVGGTRLVLDAANQRADEVVWNDLEWLSTNAGGGAGGGGVSALSGRPPFQRGLNVPGRRRVVPDVSAHASILPGWPVVTDNNWVVDGGTSAASPLMAAGFAVLSARERAAGRPPLGPVNGLLYALEAGTPGTVFDVVSGANGYSRKVPGLPAGPGYDQASGLGVPRFDRLAAALPPPAE